MNIKTIEPTPSPNTMKVLLDQELKSNERNNYTKDTIDQAPKLIKHILEIPGVKGVYHVADFLALERNARYDWKDILLKVREVFGEENSSTSSDNSTLTDTFGEVKVFVQFFKGIPMQLKITDGQAEKRVGLHERFMKAAMSTETASSNLVMERQWKEQGVRYGTLEEIGQEVADEISAAYPDDRLDRLVSQALSKIEQATSRQSYKVTVDMLDDADWTKRYAHLEQMNPTEDDIPVLEKALHDEKPSIRRLATVYLGMIESEDVLSHLFKALQDPSVTVRRTAGDCLSDIGNEKAIAPMIKALKDKNKLVRWRAAMFLYEVGDESALLALREAENDPEFEVSMQIKLAIERIAGGEEAKGSVWKQMTESRKSE
ncbi:conserved virulence factor C family protein [Bacillus suaedaesalsae]|uniref:Conserved virulence factor C family protein n=1 Tax=Bacillus suaedaesalsae TaxID=2810349 RepID=A0ABS2DP04_9BACI|nr:conserved virulence factor C family protein [Bacillus suaedaesalsae]MBM6619346.1 conserved virulence factor C family protein [Bacillus suaedaesalsae]